MEYVFGTHSEMEILKTKGKAHTNLTGWQETVRDFSGGKITDRYRVVRKLDSKEDVEGNCYDWYEIDRHYRMEDKTGPAEKNAANIDYLSMMVGVDLPEGGENDAQPEV